MQAHQTTPWTSALVPGPVRQLVANEQQARLDDMQNELEELRRVLHALAHNDTPKDKQDHELTIRATDLDPNITNKAKVLHASMWDLTLFLFVHGMDAAAIWGLLVFGVTVLVQATISFIVVTAMATDPNIDEETVADLRRALLLF